MLIAALPQFRSVAFLLDQIFRYLEAHHHFPELRLEALDLAVLSVEPFLQPLRPAFQKHPAPLFNLVRRHLRVTRHPIDRLATQHAQHYLRLPCRAPPFRDLAAGGSAPVGAPALTSS